MPRSSIVISAVFALAALGATSVDAQQLGRVDLIDSNTGTYYFHVEPGEATIQVSAVGSVRQPGLYEVQHGTDLHRLLVLAGGPQLTPRSSNVSRDVRIKLYRHGSSHPVYSATLDEAMSTSGTPRLQEGDALMIEVIDRDRFNWRDAFTVVGGLTTVVLLVTRILDFSN